MMLWWQVIAFSIYPQIAAEIRCDKNVLSGDLEKKSRTLLHEKCREIRMRTILSK